MPNNTVHAPCMLHACSMPRACMRVCMHRACSVHASCPVQACVCACSMLRAPFVGTYGNLWEVMGIFCVFFALQGVFSQCFLHCWAFFRCVFCAAGCFFHNVFSLSVVFTLRVFAASRFCTTFFTLQDVFRCAFRAMSHFSLCVFAARRFFVVHFVLCRVFRYAFSALSRFSLCILCYVAFSLRLCVLCRDFASCFDTFSEPWTTLLVPMQTFPKPQYVPVCRMYVTAFVNMLLLYV